MAKKERVRKTDVKHPVSVSLLQSTVRKAREFAINVSAVCQFALAAEVERRCKEQYKLELYEAQKDGGGFELPPALEPQSPVEKPVKPKRSRKKQVAETHGGPYENAPWVL